MKLLIAIFIPLAVGITAAFFTTAGVEGWYAIANKPSFNPPNGVFAPVWTLLYILMGIASYKVWSAALPFQEKKVALTWYAIQLLLNFAWSIIFFYLHQPGWALIEVIALWISIAITTYYFSGISKQAAWLMIPYLLWVSFATVLNAAVWHLNR